MPLDVVVFYGGLVAAVIGTVCLLKPVALIGIRTRSAAGAILFAGLVIVFVAAYGVGGRLVRAGGVRKLDDFMPAYHFHEVHSIRVHAPVARTYEALRAVTPREIGLLKSLLEIRQLPARLLGRSGQPPLLPAYVLRSESRQDPDSHVFLDAERPVTVTGKKVSLVYELREHARPATAEEIVRTYVDAGRKKGGVLLASGDSGATLKLGPRSAETWLAVAAEEGGRRYRVTMVAPTEAARPILDLFTSSDFMLLAEERGREIVLGTVSRAWEAEAGATRPRIGGPEAFASFSQPGYTKITCNLFVEGEEDGWSSVRTETRVLATDRPAWRRFALYWRLIYPGSALIRREWLKAIKRRAEAPEAPLTAAAGT
ncbi:MAG TPA: hypothetical protein VGL15_10870 [Vicinamibacteria bacterium]